MAILSRRENIPIKKISFKFLMFLGEIQPLIHAKNVDTHHATHPHRRKTGSLIAVIGAEIKIDLSKSRISKILIQPIIINAIF